VYSADTDTATEPITSRNCDHSSGGLYLHCERKNVGAGQPKARATSLWIDECGAQQAAGFKTALARSSGNARHQLWLSSFVCCTEHLSRNDQGVSHAKWLEDNYECSPT
jgi:hypothetical protein